MQEKYCISRSLYKITYKDITKYFWKTLLDAAWLHCWEQSDFWSLQTSAALQNFDFFREIFADAL